MILGKILSWFTADIIGAFADPLRKAYEAKLRAETDAQKLEAEDRIEQIKARRDIALAESGDRWSATRIGRLLIVVPFGIWWAAIFAIQILNPMFGLSLVVIDIPQRIWSMTEILIPAIIVADAGSIVTKRIFRK